MKVVTRKTGQRYFLFKFPFFRFKRRTIPHLVPVNMEKHLIDNPMELKLYEALSKENYYVTPKVKCGRVEINLALIPFRVAILEKKQTLSPKHEKLLKKKGWNIVYYCEEELKEDFYSVLQRINNVAKSYNELLAQPN